MSWVDMNVLRQVGHVERMENEWILKRVMNGRVNGRGARGRPRLGWMDGLERVLREKGMDLREAKERARDRNDWRAVMRQFGEAFVPQLGQQGPRSMKGL